MNNISHMEGMGTFFGIGFGLFALGSLLFIIIAIFSLVLKGCALWISAKRDEKGWFVALLIVNTMGILEIFYLYTIAGKTFNDLKSIFNKKESSPSSEPPSAPLQ